MQRLNPNMLMGLLPAERKLVEAGMPMNALGVETAEIQYLPYIRGRSEVQRKYISAQTQALSVNEYLRALEPRHTAGLAARGIWVLDSETGVNALGLAGIIGRRYVDQGYKVRFVDPGDPWLEDPVELLVVMGLDSQTPPDMLWRARAHVRRHTNALVLLVTAFGDADDLGVFLARTLRTQVQYAFFVADDVNAPTTHKTQEAQHGR